MSSTGRPLGSRYHLTEIIGRGAMGEVWHGVDHEGRAHACKVLKPAYSQDDEIIQRFVAERRLLTGIDHPHVVRVHDLVIEGATLAIVMELVTGGDLNGLLRAHGSLPPAQVALLGAQIARGLQAIHARHVVHRDIKPENVLIDLSSGHPVPKITDFGVARLSDDELTVAQPTVLAGTPHYMAPELFAGQTPSPRSDLYALGIVLYQLCCGTTPFSGRPSAAVMYAQTNLLPGRPGGIPDPIWQVIEQCLRKSPEQRPTDAAEVAVTLEALVPVLGGLAAAPMLHTPPEAAEIPTDGALAETMLARPPRHQPAIPDDIFAHSPTMPPSAGSPVTSWPAAPAASPQTSWPGQPQGSWQGQGSAWQAQAPWPGWEQAPAPQVSAPKPSRSHGPLIAVLSGLLVVAVAAAVVLFLRQRESQEATANPTAAITASTAVSPSSEAPSPSASPSSSTPSPTPSAALPAGAKQCSPRSAVNDVTTCEFAANVLAAYDHAADKTTPLTIKAYSPVTHQDYEMVCTGSPLVTCAGGTGAEVFIIP